LLPRLEKREAMLPFFENGAG